MPVRLTIHLSDEPARVRTLEGPGEFVLGRDPSCDVVLDDARVSRRHAGLLVAPEKRSITDLGSKNGLAVDGRTVQQASLSDACWISVGGLLVQFENGERALAAGAADRLRRDATMELHRGMADPGLGVGDLVDRLLRSVIEMSRAERGFLLLARDGSSFEVVASRGLSAAAVAGRDFSGSASTVRQVLASAERVLRSDALASAVGPSASVLDRGIRALLCVPLVADGRTLGAVYADSHKPGAVFDELDVEILGALVEHAALAIWAAGLKQELAGLARGLPTRLDHGGRVSPLPGFPTWSIPQARLPGERL